MKQDNEIALDDPVTPRTKRRARKPPASPKQDCQQMIAEAAYYRARARGFVPGCELDDWLAAEAEVDPARNENDSA